MLHYKGVYLKNEVNELVIITELITSGSLGEYIKRVKNLKVKVIKQWFSQILLGIALLHSTGIFHGRINAQTIYILTGEAWVGDICARYIKAYSLSISKLSMTSRVFRFVPIGSFEQAKDGWEVRCLLPGTPFIGSHHIARAQRSFPQTLQADLERR